MNDTMKLELSNWMKDYSNINLLTNQEIKDRRKEFDEVKKEVKSIKGQ